MARLSEFEARTAISAIIEREEREGIISPDEVSLRNRVWIHRNLKKHLEPVLTEVMDRLGLDKHNIERVIAQHQDEVTRYLKEQQPETDKKFTVFEKRYQEEMANRKALVENIIALAPTAGLIYIDRPIVISAIPPGNILIEDHIESFKSFAKVNFRQSEDWSSGYRSVSFWFVWRNESDDDVVVKSASAFLTARGKLSAHADWSVTWPNWAWVGLYGGLGAGSDKPSVAVYSRISRFAMWALVQFGGDVSKDVFRTVVPSVPEVLVQVDQLAILCVRMFIDWGMGEGEVKAELDKNEPFVSCPLLWLNVETLPSVETFSETLTVDEGWVGRLLSRTADRADLAVPERHACQTYASRFFGQCCLY